jgi:hypothetical protein
MKTANTFGVHFAARPRKSDPAILSIYVRITINKKVAEVSLKRTVNAVFWDGATEIVRGNKTPALQLNPFLDDVRYKLMESFRKLHTEGASTQLSVKPVHLKML